MPFRRLCVCDVCGATDERYAPPGWRMTSTETKAVKGEEMYSASALICSDACEIAWRETQASEREEDLTHE
jgi:hypothetical protein